MYRRPGIGAPVGWLAAHGKKDELAGAAFLIGPNIALSCAHVVRDHLGLSTPTSAALPTGQVVIQFPALPTNREVTGNILRQGWFPDLEDPADCLADIAVIRLDREVKSIPFPAIARKMPDLARQVRVYGATKGFQQTGQLVTANIAGTPLNSTNWRQLDPISSGGFSVERGFSGAPVLDELGNVAWGMIVAVAKADVAYAIPADELRAALAEAGVDSEIRISDNVDADANSAMVVLREHYESTLKEVSYPSTGEVEHLRDAVRALEKEARVSDTMEPIDAISALAGGTVDPAVQVHRERAKRRRNEAADASRQLGTVLSLTDVAEARSAYLDATELDPDNTSAWLALGGLESASGSQRRAIEAYEKALLTSDEGDPAQGAALTGIGDALSVLGDIADALDAYQKAFNLDQRILQSDPSNEHWQNNLSVSYERIGDLLRYNGDIDRAFEAYDRALKIRLNLSSAAPSSSHWKYNLGVGDHKIGDMHLACGRTRKLSLHFRMDRRLFRPSGLGTRQYGMATQPCLWL